MTNLLFDRHEDLVLFAKAQIRPSTEVGRTDYSPFEQFLLGHRSFSHCAMDYVRDLQSQRTVLPGELVLSEDQKETVQELVKVAEILLAAENSAVQTDHKFLSLELFKDFDLSDLVGEGRKLK